MSIPSSTWDESSPLDSTFISATDEIIRTLKTQVREVLAVDHAMASSGQALNAGYHNKVTLYKQSTSVSYPVGPVYLVGKELFASTDNKTELSMVSAAGQEHQLTYRGSFVGGLTNEVKMFYGLISEIPSNWTLDYRHFGKFVRGINTTITEPRTLSGGADSITITSANIPSHTHTPNTTGSGHTHIFSVDGASARSGNYPKTSTIINSYMHDGFCLDGYGEHNHLVTTEGATVITENRPAYFELAFLIRRPGWA